LLPLTVYFLFGDLLVRSHPGSSLLLGSLVSTITSPVLRIGGFVISTTGWFEHVAVWRDADVAGAKGVDGSRISSNGTCAAYAFVLCTATRSFLF
jgi:hypothetical protein